MRKAMQSDTFFKSLLALAVVALFAVPAVAQWLGPERSQPSAQIIMDEDFVAETGIATTFIGPAPKDR